MNYQKPIFVTGTQRSGTTWVGKMISKSPSIGYIHEPFVKADRPGICGYKFIEFDHFFAYVSKEKGNFYYEPLKKTLSFYYNPCKEIRVARSLKDFLRIVRDFSQFIIYRATRRRPLVKDPNAMFSAEWLASAFGMDVIVMIRHPAAYVSSMKMLKWKMHFSEFLEQEELIRDYLYPFEKEMRDHSEKNYDVIDTAILLWKISTYMILKYKKAHSHEWIFVRHEDLSRDPLQAFQAIFEKLDLEFNDRISTEILKYTDSVNPSEPSDPFFLKRNSKSNIWNWKNRLSTSEIQRIKDQVKEISQEFYSDEDW